MRLRLRNLRKIHPNRLTMTLAAINRASVILFLATGTGKAEVVRAILDPKTEAERQLPASLVRPEEGRLIWFLDQSCSSRASDTVTVGEHMRAR